MNETFDDFDSQVQCEEFFGEDLRDLMQEVFGQ